MVKQIFILDFFFQVLCRWVLSVKKNYRPVKYHNWRHALNVAQTMFAMLKTGKMERFMTDLEVTFFYIIYDNSYEYLILFLVLKYSNK